MDEKPKKPYTELDEQVTKVVSQKKQIKLMKRELIDKFMSTFYSTRIDDKNSIGLSEAIRSKKNRFCFNLKHQENMMKKEKNATNHFRYLRPTKENLKGCQFGIFMPLHLRWNEYVNRVFPGKIEKDSAEVPTREMINKLLTLEYVGAYMIVLKCKCKKRENQSGIVIQESTKCFTVVNRKNRVLKLPKAGSMFGVLMNFNTNSQVVVIYGDKFIIKPGERVAKKVKMTNDKIIEFL